MIAELTRFLFSFTFSKVFNFRFKFHRRILKINEISANEFLLGVLNMILMYIFHVVWKSIRIIGVWKTKELKFETYNS